MTASTLTTCTLDIGGMTCASCLRHVEKAPTRGGGVDAAAVDPAADLATEVATVGHDPPASGSTTAADARSAVRFTAITGWLVVPLVTGNDPDSRSRRRLTLSVPR